MNLMKLKKILYVIMIMVFIIVCMNINLSYAKINTDVKIDPLEGKQFFGIGNSILSTIYVIGVFASVAALMIKGIKFMLGSVEEKSEQKQTLIYYLIGAILVILIPQVVNLIYQIASNIF